MLGTAESVPSRLLIRRMRLIRQHPCGGENRFSLLTFDPMLALILGNVPRVPIKPCDR